MIASRHIISAGVDSLLTPETPGMTVPARSADRLTTALADRHTIERFLAEIKTTANLQHPHILPLFDSGEVRLSHPERSDPEDRAVEGPRTALYYVMPYVEGISLRDRITREH